MTERTRFNFAEFKRCVEGKLVEGWLSCFTEQAEWIEYRQWSPPKHPNRMVGKEAISQFMKDIAAEDNLTLRITNEVISDERMAFRVTCSFPDGREIIEHVIAELQDGKIVRQVDVEAWDQGLH